MSSQSAACFLACFFSPSVVDDQDLLGVQALGGTALYVLAESPDPAEFVLKSISIVEHARLYQRKQTLNPPMQPAKGSLEKGSFYPSNGASLWLDTMASETPTSQTAKGSWVELGNCQPHRAGDSGGKTWGFAVGSGSCYRGSQCSNKTCVAPIFHFRQGLLWSLTLRNTMTS